MALAPTSEEAATNAERHGTVGEERGARLGTYAQKMLVKGLWTRGECSFMAVMYPADGVS